MVVVQQELGSSVNITFMPRSDFLWTLSPDFRNNLDEWEEKYNLICGVVDSATKHQGTRDQIAVRVTHTPRPQTQLIGEMPTDKVMKRCYSSYQTYVIILNEVEIRTPPFYHSKGVLNIPVAIGWTKIGLCLLNNGVSSKYTLSI